MLKYGIRISKLTSKNKITFFFWLLFQNVIFIDQWLCALAQRRDWRADGDSWERWLWTHSFWNLAWCSLSFYHMASPSYWLQDILIFLLSQAKMPWSTAFQLDLVFLLPKHKMQRARARGQEEVNTLPRVTPVKNSVHRSHVKRLWIMTRQIRSQNLFVWVNYGFKY